MPQMDSQSTALFVYGTLAPGEENAHIMDGMEGIWRRATVCGTRHNTGWGVNKGHPGLIPDENADPIEGLVFISDDLPKNWARLDAFEGKDYRRITIQATLDTGETLAAQIYSVGP